MSYYVHVMIFHGFFHILENPSDYPAGVISGQAAFIPYFWKKKFLSLRAVALLRKTSLIVVYFETSLKGEIYTPVRKILMDPGWTGPILLAMTSLS